METADDVRRRWLRWRAERDAAVARLTAAMATGDRAEQERALAAAENVMLAGWLELEAVSPSRRH